MKKKISKFDVEVKLIVIPFFVMVVNIVILQYLIFYLG